jgi:hypothetical protein
MRIFNLPFTILKEFVAPNLKNLGTFYVEEAVKSIDGMPVTFAKINIGHNIDRIRPHLKDFRAETIQQLSYIKDKNILNNKKLNHEFGRANVPGEAMFYGSLLTPEIQQNRATAFMETSNMFYDSTIQEEYFTVSRWEIIETFEVYEVVFQDELKQITKTAVNNRKVHEKFIETETKGNAEAIKEAYEKLSFFSKEFAKKVSKEENELYRISAFFTKIFLAHPKSKNKVWGIVYPSVKSGHLGQNIAILPLAADKFLKFQRADVMKATRQADGKILVSKSIAAAESVDENGCLLYTSPSPRDES